MRERFLELVLKDKYIFHIDIIFLNKKQLILYTMDGKEVKRSKEKEINLYAEPKGIYLLKIIKMNGDYSIQKIIKK